MVNSEEERTARINFVLPKKLKAEWERFSSDVVHASMSQMIRDAVREYMQRKEPPKQPAMPEPVIVQNDMLEKRIESIVSKKMDEFLDKVQIPGRG